MEVVEAVWSIGLALISQQLCTRIQCKVDGEFVGQRMSGQEVRVPLTRLERLMVGGAVEAGDCPIFCV